MHQLVGPDYELQIVQLTELAGYPVAKEVTGAPRTQGPLTGLQVIRIGPDQV